MRFFRNYYLTLANCIASIQNNEPLLASATAVLQETHDRGGKVVLAGNGGSAAMASHVSVDMTKTLGLRAVNFNEADLITCFANDYGHDHWIEKALESYADPKDIVVLISSSGKSANILNAALKTKQMNLPLITFSGFSADNPLRSLGDINFWADSRAYNIVEMTHHVWLLSLLDKLVADKSANP